MRGLRRAARRRRYLRIYLNDHLMGSSFGVELARRCLRSNEGTPLGVALVELLAELVEDRRTLLELMAALGASTNRIKVIGAVLGERVGRIKLNGRLAGYSDQSRLLELEALYGGVDLKLRMWLALQQVAVADPRMTAVDIDRMIERATSQRARIERHRFEAAERAFG